MTTTDITRRIPGLVDRLAERAASYRLGGSSSEHTASLLDEAAAALSLSIDEIKVWREIAERHSALAKERGLEVVRLKQTVETVCLIPIPHNKRSRCALETRRK